MTIVDTTIWVDYLRGTETLQTIWLDQAIGKFAIGLTDLILCEILQGAPAWQLVAMREELRHYDLFVAGGEALVVTAANNYRLLRSRGITIRKTIDCLIATFCLTEGYTLLHNHRDFDPFEEMLGLQVVHPQSH